MVKVIPLLVEGLSPEQRLTDQTLSRVAASVERGWRSSGNS